MRQSLCALFALSVALVLVVGCGPKGPVKRNWGPMKGLDKVVGNMNNVSYSKGRTQAPRLNAVSEPVSMTDFAGEFVWVEYAAPWCEACTWQAPGVKKVEQELGDQMVFLTVMTGKSRNYNDHASVQTAKRWAKRYGLKRKRVVAAELWFKTIPEHRLYSPKGHTLFVHVGALSGQQIRDVIAYYRSGYEMWAKTGELADWMKAR